MNRKFIFLLVLFCCTLFIYGCSSNTEEDEGINENADTSGGELHFATNAQPATLDPHMSEATIVRDIARHVFEPLLTVNSNYEVEPMLVESYEESEDGKQITFNLRQGIKFHNGEEMTSEDVVASMERWYERSNTAQTALEGSSFEAIDDYTVVLHVENPSVFVLPSLAGTIQFAGIMPKEIIENASETGVEEYIGTGPFQFKEWRQDQYILLEKFADYQALDEPADGLAGKKEALVDDLYIHIVNDPSTRLTGLMTDEYDIGFAYEVDMLDQLESADDVEIISPMVGYSVVIYNKNEGLFKDLKMRQAVNTALSMEEIGQASFLDRYRINPSIAPEEQVDWYSEQGEEHYNLADIEKAKSLLEEAGYNGEPIRLVTSRDYSYMYNTSVVVQDQLEKAGMNVELEVLDWATVLSSLGDSSTWELSVMGFNQTTTPLEQVQYNSWVDGTDDPEIDRLLGELRTTTSQEEAKELWGDLQAYSWEYLPVTKLVDMPRITAFKDRVEGFTFLDGPVLWNTKVNK